jgi:hypothetical protein
LTFSRPTPASFATLSRVFPLLGLTHKDFQSWAAAPNVFYKKLAGKQCKGKELGAQKQGQAFLRRKIFC